MQLMANHSDPLQRQCPVISALQMALIRNPSSSLVCNLFVKAKFSVSLRLYILSALLLHLPTMLLLLL